MNKGQEMEEQEEQDNIIEFKKPHLAVDNTVPSDDWLMKLPIGTVFFAMRKNYPHEEQAFLTTITDKRDALVEIVQDTLHPDNAWQRWVISERYCRNWDCVEVVSYGSGHRAD